jgi:2-isopropylmalate synthase
METPWDVSGKYSVSRYCYADGVRATMPNLPKQVEVRDITFREGDDNIGLRISVENKLKMMEYGYEMGVRGIDIGSPSMHPHHYAFAKAVSASGIPVLTTGRFFTKNVTDYKRNVDMNIECGVRMIKLVIMQLNREITLKQLEALPDIISYIHSCGVPAQVTLSDCTRAPIDLFDKVYQGAIDAGADHVGIPDTFGVATPAAMKWLFNRLHGMLRPGMHMKAHMHNTFGLAVANTLACVEGGADSVDGAVNGYGDEAGNASLEEIVVALEALYGVDTGFKTEMLKGYSDMAVKYGQVPIQPHKAIVGDNAFRRPKEIWAGVDMAKESWMLHPAIWPEYVGTRDYVCFGTEASLDDEVLEYKFKEHHIPYTANDIIKVRHAVEERLKEEQIFKFPTWYITEEQFDDMLKKMYNV